ncbi:UNVERIFIED_CONTAM: hypothetical protein GTU68_066531, partial [Idotea baltica]|nr:hypothetical protein [Idotea baltica]
IVFACLWPWLLPAQTPPANGTPAPAATTSLSRSSETTVSTPQEAATPSMLRPKTESSDPNLEAPSALTDTPPDNKDQSHSPSPTVRS